MKRCTKCREYKELDEFGADRQKRDGLRPDCKDCKRWYSRQKYMKDPATRQKARKASKDWYRANSEQAKKYKRKWIQTDIGKKSAAASYKKHREDRLAYAKEYYKNNREKMIEYSKKYAKENPDKIKAYRKKRYENNRDYFLAKSRDWYENNKDRARAWRRKYLAENTDQRIRVRISSGINRGIKTGKEYGVFRHLPYTLDELVAHLESTMPRGHDWGMLPAMHIDHIRPVSSFNIERIGDDEFLKCWALDNLRLLPADENMYKGSKIIDQPSTVGA